MRMRGGGGEEAGTRASSINKDLLTVIAELGVKPGAEIGRGGGRVTVSGWHRGTYRGCQSEPLLCKRDQSETW